MSPFGVTMGTPSNLISSDSMILPLPFRTGIQILSAIHNQTTRHQIRPYSLLAFSAVLALLTSAFSNLPFLVSAMVSSRVETRAVYPASSERSLYEYMTRPKASTENLVRTYRDVVGVERLPEAESRRRRFVTKPDRRMDQCTQQGCKK